MEIVKTGIDLSYAGATMDYGRVKNAGYSLVMRYLGNDTRCVTKAEMNRIFQAGLRMGMIGQIGAVTRPRGGYRQGLADGEFFANEAKELGAPKGSVIICAIADVGEGFPTYQDLPQIREYARGEIEKIKPAGFRYGIYGPYWILEEFRDHLDVFCYWQTAGGSGGGAGTGGRAFNPGDGSWRRLSNLACMYQEYSNPVISGTDHNQVYDANIRSFTWHPDDANDQDQPEENYDMKAVFCQGVEGVNPNVGWRAVTVDGKRYREGYEDIADLDADMDAGLIDGNITLTGARAARFIYRYPELPYTGPRLVGITGDTKWGSEVAKLAPGEMGRFYVVPNRYAVRVSDDDQWNGNRFVGIPHADLPSSFMYNQPLVPWSVDLVLDEDVEVDATITMADKTEIATMTTNMLAKRLED